MSRKVSLNIEDALFRKVEQCARKKGENVQDFLIKAVCDALDMWEDFYTAPEPSEKRSNIRFFINN